MLAIARGLMASAEIAGSGRAVARLVAPARRGDFALIAGLRERGMAILLSEQNARLSLAIADRGYVIENGRVAVSGNAGELLQSSDIAARYLGVGADVAAQSVSRDEHYTAKLRQLMGDAV